MRLTAAAFALGILLSPAAWSQWKWGAQVATLLDDNAFNNYLQVHDRLTEVSLQAGYDWETESNNTQLLYTGLLGYFHLYPGRTYQLHAADFIVSHLEGENDETLLIAGATFALRDNHKEYSIYDHSRISLFGNARTYLSDLLLLKAAYAFSSVAFSSLGELDFSEHTVTVHAGLSLPTRTSLLGQIDLGFKNYREANADTAAGTGAHRGRMRMLEEAGTPGVTQMIGTLRIGQGFSDHTGLSLTGQYQLSLRRETRYLTFEDALLTDDEVFDDHYGYDGPLGSLMVTQILPAEFRLRVSGTLQERRYSNRPAYSLLGAQVAPQRIDRRSTVSLSLDKTLSDLGLQAILAYDHIVNASNDVFFRYRNEALSLRFTYTY